jgi:hypothetical protein
MKRILLLILAVFVVTLPLSAANPKSDFTQGKSSKGGRVGTEWGLTGAVYLNTTTIDPAVSGIQLTPKLGYGAGLHMGLKIGNFFAIQPEVNYQRANIYVKLEDKKLLPTKVTTNTVDIPVLLSLRLANVVRINAGPVFTVKNDCFYDLKNKDTKEYERFMFGQIRPTFGYSAGVALVLFRKYMIDVRYIGYFKTQKLESGKFNALNNFNEVEFGTQTNSLAIKIGYIF